ncbi:MAG: D-glycero-beta-D-manno-heptose 1-phosphate adenylyltransferase [Candidatus Omnitrophota bacterium]|jgi:rfaE bifunctional protein nucleotidyltransferase chain/domain|nr:D-glycero-beta-D-manno-heptose 1-phosphate adenylyltransferase [Candidatus Omnitrophota bacterium]
MSNNKIKTLSQLKTTLKKPRARKKKLVFTNGCFDILHTGHVNYLQKAKNMGDILIVGLNSDASVRRLKGRSRPIVSQKNRAKVLAALSAVDLTVVFNSLTPIELIKAVKPDVLVKGGDWPVKDIVGSGFVQSYGGKVKSLAYIKGFSTKDIIAKIKRS